MVWNPPILNWLIGLYGIASPEVVSDEYTTEDNFPISGNYVTLAEAKDACEKIEFERLLTGQTIREALNPIYAEIKDAMDASIEKYVLPKPPEPATEPEPVNAEWKHISGSVWELLQGVKDYYCLEKLHPLTTAEQFGKHTRRITRITKRFTKALSAT